MNTRLLCLAAALAVSVTQVSAQAPPWLWARTGGGATATDYCRGAACDATGATYITGDFYGPGCLLGGALYDSVGNGADAYVIRYLADGTPAWVRVLGGTGAESGVDIDTDSTGAAILTGTYGTSPLDCGTNAAGQTVSLTLPSAGGRGVLLVKLNALGQTEWATGFSGTGTAAGNEVSTGPSDEILVTGPFAQNGTTLTLPDGAVLTKAGGDADVFVAKFSAAGAFQWGFGLNGDAHEEGRGISADAAGNVLVCGEFDGNLTLGSNAHQTAGLSDIFVAKYSPSGGFVWSRRFGGTGADAARGIDPAADGGVIVSGEFTGTIAFDNFTLTAAGTTKDLFLIKLSALGAVEWARSFGSPSADQGCEIEADATGNIYCAGSARTGLVFPGGTTLNSAGLSDQFVAKFNASGTLLWATNGGGPGSDSNFALGLDPQGRASVVGFYSGSATYGPDTITGNGTSIDFYLARLDGDGMGQASIGISAPVIQGGSIELEITAPNDTWYALQTSTDLLQWQTAALGEVLHLDRQTLALPLVPGEARRFFRALTPPPMRLIPGAADLLAGESMTFSALISGSATSGVNWSVIEPGGGTVNTSGVYTAPMTAGVFHVRASAQSNPDLFAEAQVNVVIVSNEELVRYTAAADYSDSVLGDGLLIMKSGAIVFERYTGATTATSAHLLASGTKSFSAALFALGAADGIWTLDENVSQTITEWLGVANKQDITIRQLISLTSGLLDSPEYSAGNAANLDTYDLAINASSTPQPPGVACIYAPSNFQVLAAMFERKTGLDPLQYLYDRLLARLGFNAAHLPLWTRDNQGKPQMAGGAYFDARAWANYGKLWLQGGQWEGRTLLDPQFLNLAVTYDNAAFKGYGFTWWLNLPTGTTYNPGVDQIPVDGRGDGTQIATNAPTDLFMAAGTGKQRLYVIPSQNLVIVRFGRGTGSSFSDHTLLGHILGVP